MKKPLIYIAGPYTQGDTTRNVQNALKVAEEINKRGGVCIVPHLSHLWDLISPHDYMYWLDMDHDYIEHCQAIYRIGGYSPGAETEEEKAEELGIPVFHNLGRRQSLQTTD